MSKTKKLDWSGSIFNPMDAAYKTINKIFADALSKPKTLLTDPDHWTEYCGIEGAHVKVRTEYHTRAHYFNVEADCDVFDLDSSGDARICMSQIFCSGDEDNDRDSAVQYQNDVYDALTAASRLFRDKQEGL